MHHEIHFVGDSEDKIDVVVHSYGTACIEGFEAYLREVFGDPRWRPCMNAVCDLTQLDASAFDDQAVQRLADLHAQFARKLGDGLVAIAAGTPVNYGVVRMWQAYVDDRVHVQSDVFYTLEEARAWLVDRSLVPG